MMLLPKQKFCSMCGAVAGDQWLTHPTRKAILSVKPRAGDFSHSWIICNECNEGLLSLFAQGINPFNPARTVRLTMGHIKDKSKGGDDSPGNLRALCTNCNEGLQNTNLPTPDQVWLLSQIRRATIDDQKVVLDWLQKKFSSRK